MPSDETRRNRLEVVDIHLNDFVPDEDYSVAKQQRGGLSQALKGIHSGEKMDAMQILKAVSEGVTTEGEAQLNQIQERVRRDNQTTLERQKELRREADQLRRR